MFPNLFFKPTISIFTLKLSSYFLFMFTGIFLAAVLLLYLTRKEKEIDRARLFDFMLTVIFCGLLGAKLFHVLIEKPAFFFKNPMNIFRYWNLGFVYYGGLIGGLVGGVLYSKFAKISFFKFADIVSPFLSFGLAIGRMGCLSAGCCYGKPTDFFWGITFSKTKIVDNVIPQVLARHPEYIGVMVHPTQIISVLCNFMIFIILIFIAKNKRFDGQIVFLLCILYSAFRFFLEFLRGDEGRGMYFNNFISTSQIIAVLIFIFSIVLYLKRRNKENK
ncbi:MAG: prolipoprotein diacylglyceryl transferase [Pseudomonadota bacterium]